MHPIASGCVVCRVPSNDRQTFVYCWQPLKVHQWVCDKGCFIGTNLLPFIVTLGPDPRLNICQFQAFRIGAQKITPFTVWLCTTKRYIRTHNYINIRFQAFRKGAQKLTSPIYRLALYIRPIYTHAQLYKNKILGIQKRGTENYPFTVWLYTSNQYILVTIIYARTTPSPAAGKL